MMTNEANSKNNIQDLMLVNYCHPDCVPMLNIMRLPEEEAYAKARELADIVLRILRIIIQVV